MSELDVPARIVPSGMGMSRSFAAEDVSRAAGALLAEELEKPRPPSPWRAAEGLRASSVNLGPYAAGPVKGLAIGDAWVAVTRSPDPALLDALKPLVKLRDGRVASFATDDEIERFWRKERQNDLRAICLVGQGISWRLQERLQLDGCLVGRLPFSDGAALRAYTAALAVRQREKIQLPRLAWIVETDVDDFTRSIADTIASPLEIRLEESHHFKVFRSGPELSEDEARALPPPGLVVLLTHGADPPEYGYPVPLGPRARAKLLAACKGGALVAHLGCNGAGMAAGGRFGALLRQLNLECPRLPEDGFSEFGQACLAAGATAVLAHVDSTWSNAFAHAGPLLDWVGWSCSGEGAMAYAAESIFDEANRLGAEAYQQISGGDELRAGLAWLRHRDLSGFVCLGDGAAHCRWSR